MAGEEGKGGEESGHYKAHKPEYGDLDESKQELGEPAPEPTKEEVLARIRARVAEALRSPEAFVEAANNPMELGGASGQLHDLAESWEHAEILRELNDRWNEIETSYDHVRAEATAADATLGQIAEEYQALRQSLGSLGQAIELRDAHATTARRDDCAGLAGRLATLAERLDREIAAFRPRLDSQARHVDVIEEGVRDSNNVEGRSVADLERSPRLDGLIAWTSAQHGELPALVDQARQELEQVPDATIWPRRVRVMQQALLDSRNFIATGEELLRTVLMLIRRVQDNNGALETMPPGDRRLAADTAEIARQISPDDIRNVRRFTTRLKSLTV